MLRPAVAAARRATRVAGNVNTCNGSTSTGTISALCAVRAAAPSLSTTATLHRSLSTDSGTIATAAGNGETTKKKTTRRRAAKREDEAVAGKAERSIEDTYQKKTQREHILLRPDQYIGSMQRSSSNQWILQSPNLSDPKIVARELSVIPGLFHLFDEILVNAADNQHRGRMHIRSFKLSLPMSTLTHIVHL
jgi:hypothetical protein